VVARSKTSRQFPINPVQGTYVDKTAVTWSWDSRPDRMALEWRDLPGWRSEIWVQARMAKTKLKLSGLWFRARES